jgi:hypothetical protein
MIPFSPWQPDVAAFNNQVSTDVLNVIPSVSGFRPFPAFSNITSAITARAQGAISVRGLTGVVSNFCGDATKLYKMASTGLTWTDVSRTVGGAYGTTNDGWWDFTLFGDIVIATNNTDVPQKFQVDVDTNFALLAGSPPTAAFTGVIRDFAVLARKSASYPTIQWSAINNCADWAVSATTLSDSQLFPDGGIIMGFIGGEYGLVFLEKAIYRMNFEGPPTVFRFDKISHILGCRAERSIAAYENLAFFLSDDGPYMVRGGSEIIDIGTNKVDRWIEENLNSGYLYRISSTIDPINMLYIMGMPSISSSSGSPDTLLIYHWPTEQWSKISVNHEIIYTAATQGTVTIDGLDSYASTIDTIPYPVDSRFWAGSGRLILSSFDTSHRQGYFSGANLAATLETGDTQLTQGKKSLLRSFRPMIQGTSVTPTAVIRYRDRLQDSINSSSILTINAAGRIPSRINARYHRAQLTIPASSDWDYAQGIDDVIFSQTGGR